MADTVSPLAPLHYPEMPPVAGVRLGTASSGTRYKGRPDVLIAVFDDGAEVAGVFTRSKTCSAPVDWCRENLTQHRANALAVNAGNANAFTGHAGRKTVEAVANGVADELDCPAAGVFIASTGVIGETLDPTPITNIVPGTVAQASPNGWPEAARAIMTTDTFPKLATTQVDIGGRTITVNGIAKGSGMIAPDMATMLAFVFTDAGVGRDILQSVLATAVDKSFNAITVDSDTSTSDTVLLFATGKSGAVIDSSNDPALPGFAKAVDGVLRDLAHQVVRDGEGAQKFIEIRVSGAEHDEAARKIGLAIGNSPLVKTAIAGEDANWGRIVMAVGKSGEDADRDRLAIQIGGVSVARDGMIDPDYREAMLQDHMCGAEIDIGVDVGVGSGKATVWTCDLTHGYIEINADYRS